jgi:hypothetical protein
MKRSFVLTAALVLSTLALVFSSPYASRTVRAVQGQDKCTKCLEKVGRRFDKCVAQRGETDPFCGEQFNQDIIHCFATVCEQ